MPALVREPNTKPVGQFATPYKGTWPSLSANMIQPDQLYSSLNVFIRKGKLRDRPGLRRLNPVTFNNTVIGGALVVTPLDKILLAFTFDTIYRLQKFDNDWVVDSVVDVAPVTSHAIDITFLETASQYVVIVANDSTELKRWIDGSGLSAITPTKGPIPIARSVCTAASRIVCLVDNHTIVWSDVLTYDAYNPLSYNKKPAETNDAGIGVKSLNSYDFAVYKERSIYIGRAQAGADGNAFSVQRLQIVEGPASFKAIIDFDGGHMYMTPNGRVGIFDGTSYVKWIADGLWFMLQDDIDPLHSDKIVGVFDYRLHMALFFYPKRGDDGAVKGMLTINVPLDGSGLSDFACFLGYSRFSISHAYEMRFARESNRSILFSGDHELRASFIYDENMNRDHGVAFDCHFQTGLLPMPDMKHNKVSAEVFIERGDGNGFADVSFVGSDMLESEGGTVQDLPSESINLEFNNAREYLSGPFEGVRFIGMRVVWTSDSTVRYAGAVMYGREVG